MPDTLPAFPEGRFLQQRCRAITPIYTALLGISFIDNITASDDWGRISL